VDGNSATVETPKIAVAILVHLGIFELETSGIEIEALLVILFHF
jgi:hypothetical protein